MREFCPASGKLSYPDKAAAMKVALALRRARNQRLNAYCCTSCRRWHLGRDPKAKAQRRERKQANP